MRVNYIPRMWQKLCIGRWSFLFYSYVCVIFLMHVWFHNELQISLCRWLRNVLKFVNNVQSHRYCIVQLNLNAMKILNLFSFVKMKPLWRYLQKLIARYSINISIQIKSFQSKTFLSDLQRCIIRLLMSSTIVKTHNVFCATCINWLICGAEVKPRIHGWVIVDYK